MPHICKVEMSHFPAEQAGLECGGGMGCDEHARAELNGYYALNAQDMYEKRRAVHRKLIVRPELKEAIEDRLKARWSPEQIAGRMRLEGHPPRVSHERIWRFSYSKDGREEQFYRHLPEHRRRRRPLGHRRHNQTHIFDVRSLSHRPECIAERAEFGRWECDLMMFRKEHGKVPEASTRASMEPSSDHA